MSNEPVYECRICKNGQGNFLHTAREMLFGLKDSFEYVECGRCGCVQIRKFPENMQKYYPDSYWPTEQKTPSYSASALIRRWLKRKETEYHLGTFSFIGAVLAVKAQPSSAPVFSGWNWAKHFCALKISTNSPILDVGCGAGDFLDFLWKKGFSNLYGVDPHISKPLESSGWRIHKGEISGLNRTFDLIMMHHSFEHMQRPLDVLKSANLLLNPGRHLVVRIPMATESWKKYGVNWVQLDPPRHFFLHTVESIGILARQSGFDITNIEFDSTEFQFWASEQYMLGIPLNSASSYSKSKEESIFKEEEIARFKCLAQELNAKERGDQACIYLKKTCEAI